MAGKYTFDDYNRHGVLRTPPALRLAFIVLLHQTILALVVALSHGRGGKAGGGSGGLDWNTISYWPVLLELPAIAVILAASQRSKLGAAWARRIWPHGLRLLQLDALIELGSSAWLAYRLGPSDDDFAMYVGLCAATALTFGYLCVSRYLRDYFAEFPSPPPAEPAKPN